MGSVISALGFLGKEVATVLLQPRLVASLVLGPFLIMVAFGLGYRGPHPEFRTILVLPASPAIAQQVDVNDVYREGLGGVFRLTQVTENQEQAPTRNVQISPIRALAEESDEDLPSRDARQGFISMERRRRRQCPFEGCGSSSPRVTRRMHLARESVGKAYEKNEQARERNEGAN